MSDKEHDTPDEEKRMPFLDHLEELRWRLIKSIAAVMVMAMVSYMFSEQILNFLTHPYAKFSRPLIFLAPTEGFMIRIKLALFGGLIFALPVIFYQFWKFVAPGLYPHEKKYVPTIIVISTFNFLVGAAFAYFVIVPFGLRFLIGFETPDLQASIRIKDYLSFITNLMLAFGVVFELPILAFFLTRIGIITPEFMKKYRRYAIVIVFVLAAILTPPDVFSQIALAIPLVLLYEISIWVSKAAKRKRDEAKQAEEEESASSPPPPPPPPPSPPKGAGPSPTAPQGPPEPPAMAPEPEADVAEEAADEIYTGESETTGLEYDEDYDEGQDEEDEELYPPD